MQSYAQLTCIPAHAATRHSHLQTALSLCASLHEQPPGRAASLSRVRLRWRTHEAPAPQPVQLQDNVLRKGNAQLTCFTARAALVHQSGQFTKHLHRDSTHPRHSHRQEHIGHRRHAELRTTHLHHSTCSRKTPSFYRATLSSRASRREQPSDRVASQSNVQLFFFTGTRGDMAALGRSPS